MSKFKHTGPASGRLWVALWDNYTEAEKQALVEDFQHELAERARVYLGTLGLSPNGAEYSYVECVIDLIDPKVDFNG